MFAGAAGDSPYAGGIGAPKGVLGVLGAPPSGNWGRNRASSPPPAGGPGTSATDRPPGRAGQKSYRSSQPSCSAATASSAAGLRVADGSSTTTSHWESSAS